METEFLTSDLARLTDTDVHHNKKYLLTPPFVSVLLADVAHDA